MDEFDQADPLAVALNELFLLGSAQDRTARPPGQAGACACLSPE